jgi:hypothetical protein
LVTSKPCISDQSCSFSGVTDPLVYAIRIDHWLGDFERDLMPALVKYGLPCSIAMNSQNWGVPVTTAGAGAPRSDCGAPGAGARPWR